MGEKKIDREFSVLVEGARWTSGGEGDLSSSEALQHCHCQQKAPRVHVNIS